MHRERFFAALACASLCLTSAVNGQDDIDACVKKSGKVRIVSDAAECKDTEVHLSWNQAGPEGPQGQEGPQGDPGPALRPFVGLTTATTQGNIGLFGFAPMCDAEFPDSGQCTTAEMIDSAAETQGLSGFARVRPEIVPVGNGSVLDGPSGVQTTLSDLTCGNWAVPSGSGIVAVFNEVPPDLAIAPHRGIVKSSLCGDSLAVACCRADVPASD